MDIQPEKLDLIQWLAGINDSNIVKQVSVLRKLTEKITTDKLSQSEIDAIDKGLQSVKEGRYRSDEEVRDLTKKKYPLLIK